MKLSKGKTGLDPALHLLALILLFSVLFVCGCGTESSSPASSRSDVATLGPQDAPRGGPPGPPDLKEWEGRLGPEATGKDVATPLAGPSPEAFGTLDLTAGWNLVSFPVLEVTGLQLGSGVLTSAFAFDPVSGSYQVLDLRNPANLSSGEGVGRGMWVHTSQAAQIRFSGRPNIGDQQDLDVNLAQGWNLLGFPFEQSCTFADIQAGTSGIFNPLTESVSQCWR